MNSVSQKGPITIFKYLKSVIKIAFTSAFIIYLFYIIYGNYNQILNKKLTLDPFLIILVIILYLFWLFIFECTWEFALRKLLLNNINVSRSDSALAFARSFLYKYIPGKIWFIAARTEFLKRYGIPRSYVLKATLMEQSNSFIMPLFLLGLTIPFLEVIMFSSFTIDFYRVIFFTSIIGLLIWLMFPLYLKWLIKKLITLFKVQQDYRIEIKNLSRWFLYVVFFFLLTILEGTIAIPIITDFMGKPQILNPSQLLYLIAVYPFARVIGQLGFLAPSGLGVREGAYILLASPVIGAENSTLVSVWFRFLTIITEVIFFLIIFFLSKKGKSNRNLAKALM